MSKATSGILKSRNRYAHAGYLLNLEEPALFNDMAERFIALVEAKRRGARDPRSMSAG